MNMGEERHCSPHRVCCVVEGDCMLDVLSNEIKTRAEGKTALNTIIYINIFLAPRGRVQLDGSCRDQLVREYPDDLPWAERINRMRQVRRHRGLMARNRSYSVYWEILESARTGYLNKSHVRWHYILNPSSVGSVSIYKATGGHEEIAPTFTFIYIMALQFSSTTQDFKLESDAKVSLAKLFPRACILIVIRPWPKSNAAMRQGCR